jgi:hypothetical protein
MRSHQSAAALSAGNLAIVETLGGSQPDATITERPAAPAPSSIEYVALSFLLDVCVSAASLFREVSSFSESKGYPLRRE